MTTFDRREEAFENRFAHDEELEFRAHARRNHRLGLWAAGLLGLSGQDAEEYSQTVISAAIENGGAEAIVHKISRDFSAGGVVQSEHQIRRHMDEFLVAARHEVRS